MWGVDSFENDDSVEVVYVNMFDWLFLDLKGVYFFGMIFIVSDVLLCNCNMFCGCISNGVLIIDVVDIVLVRMLG